MSTNSQHSSAPRPPHQTGTYKQIQQWVAERYGFIPDTTWIAHCKELYGLPVSDRTGYGYRPRDRQCPVDKRLALYEAFQYFGLIPR